MPSLSGSLMQWLMILARYGRAFGLIGLSLWLGNWLSLHAIALPGSILGMLILFVALVSGVVQEDWVAPGALLIMRYMALLFVPISVGMMDQVAVLKAFWLPIVGACLISSVLILLAVGWTAARLDKP